MLLETSLNELQIERVLGGYSNYCRIWTELRSMGIYFVIKAESNTTVLFAANETGIALRTVKTPAFVNIAKNVGTFEFEIRGLFDIHTAHPVFPTNHLVEEHLDFRLLWAYAVRRLNGDKDRLYDTCFEMGDGHKVSRALESMLHDAGDLPVSGWTLSAAKSHIRQILCINDIHETSANQLQLAFAAT